MDVKRVLLAGLVLLSIPGAIFGVRLVRAHGRIQHARAEAAELPETAAALQPAVDVGFDLRHPPFGVFGHPPPLPLDELLLELARARHPGLPGLDGALVRMAEERRFLARQASMRKRGLLSREERGRLQEALVAAPPRPTMAEAFRIERLLLIRQILGTYPIGGDENPLRADFPDGRDGWCADLRLARALDDLDALFESLGRASVTPGGAGLDHLESSDAGILPAKDSPLAAWVPELALHVLVIDAEIRAGFDAIR